MASDIRWWKVVSSLTLTLSIFASTLSLPLQSEYDPRNADDGLPMDIPHPPSDELPVNAGNPVPATNNDQMFPANMPAPPPGALNDEVPEAAVKEQPVHAEDLIPPQPVEQEENIAPHNKPLPLPMFPPDMPAPPPGAMNDVPVQTGVPMPGESAAENNNPLPPTENGDQMFPPNMPPPPPGAMADSVQAGLPMTWIQKNISVPVANRGQMFPPNMPPPPPGAMAEPVFNPEITPQKISETIEQTVPAVNDGTATSQGAALVAPKDSESMFPPNMPPPPPGAFADPPPSPLAGQGFQPHRPPMYPGEASQFVPADPPSDAAVEPVYLNGQAVPAQAKSAFEGENPYVDPTKLAYQQTANADTATGNINPENSGAPVANLPQNGMALSTNGSAPSTNEAASSQPNLGGSPVKQAPLAPTSEDTSAKTESQSAPYVEQGPVSAKVETTGNDTTGDSADSVDVVPPSGDKGPESSVWSEGESESSESDNVYTNEDSYENSDDSYDESDASFGAEEDEFESQEESESDYSFINFWKSESVQSDSWMDQEESEESVSSFDWLLDSSDDEFGYGESYGREWGGEDESGWSSSEELIVEAIEEAVDLEDSIKHVVDEKLNNSPDDDQNFVPITSKDTSPLSSTLLYCIPGLILTVLILLAWKNYRGKIRVVTVSSDTNSKKYDWKSSYSTDEDRQPMLKQEGDDY